MLNALRSRARRLRGGSNYLWGRSFALPLSPALRAPIEDFEMRTRVSIVTLATVLCFGSTTVYAHELFRFVADHVIGCGPKHGCGGACGCGDVCGCGAGCACEAGLGCEAGCGCEVGCDIGCSEPACGCDVGGGVNGRRFAGQTWDGCCQSGPRLCMCVDEQGNCHSGMCFGKLLSHGCRHSGGCGEACGCGAGVGVDCGCEVSCGCESGACGCESGTCGPRQGKDWFGCALLGAVGNILCPCSGCDSEFYWSEWHNDPPRCHDPCDSCGNWTGASAGYRAPYHHEFAINGAPGQAQFAGQAVPNRSSATTIANRQPPKPAQPSQRTANRPYTGPIKNFQR